MGLLLAATDLGISMADGRKPDGVWLTSSIKKYYGRHAQRLQQKFNALWASAQLGHWTPLQPPPSALADLIQTSTTCKAGIEASLEAAS